MDTIKGVVEVLKEAREIISNPSNFCTAAYARTEEGYSVHYNSKYAARWCSIGALMKVGGYDSPIYVRAKGVLGRALPKCAVNIPDFNDTFPHEEVIKVWDRAILLAEEMEKEMKV